MIDLEVENRMSNITEVLAGERGLAGIQQLLSSGSPPHGVGVGAVGQALCDGLELLMAQELGQGRLSGEDEADRYSDVFAHGSLTLCLFMAKLPSWRETRGRSRRTR